MQVGGAISRAPLDIANSDCDSQKKKFFESSHAHKEFQQKEGYNLASCTRYLHTKIFVLFKYSAKNLHIFYITDGISKQKFKDFKL